MPWYNWLCSGQLTETSTVEHGVALLTTCAEVVLTPLDIMQLCTWGRMCVHNEENCANNWTSCKLTFYTALGGISLKKIIVPTARYLESVKVLTWGGTHQC